MDVHWGEDVTSKGPCKTQVGPHRAARLPWVGCPWATLRVAADGWFHCMDGLTGQLQALAAALEGVLAWASCSFSMQE